MSEASSEHQYKLTPTRSEDLIDWESYTIEPTENITSINITTDMLINALDLQSKLARQKSLGEQEARQQVAEKMFEEASDDLKHQAASNPSYFRSDDLNRHNKARKSIEAKKLAEQHEALNRQRVHQGLPQIPKPVPTPKEHPHQKYVSYGKNRWGIAALEGVSIAPGVGGPLEPIKRRELKMALKAARRATKNISTVAAKEMLERDPRIIDENNNDKDRGGQRHGGVAIDPNTSKSRYRDLDPKLKNRHRQDRKIIKAAEKRHKKLTKINRNEIHYLKNQGSNFFLRHNITERIGDNLESIKKGFRQST